MKIGNHSKISSTGSNITSKVTIGNYTSIAPNVQMHSLVNHACIKDRKIVSTHHGKSYIVDGVTIGSDVWIGQNVVILGHVDIGDGAIIGAFSVVAKDIPPYAVVVGNPATIKRFRFTPEQIEKLLQIKWWDWPDEKIEKTDFLDIDSFINSQDMI